MYVCLIYLYSFHWFQSKLLDSIVTTVDVNFKHDEVKMFASNYYTCTCLNLFVNVSPVILVSVNLDTDACGAYALYTSVGVVEFIGR